MLSFYVSAGSQTQVILIFSCRDLTTTERAITLALVLLLREFINKTCQGNIKILVDTPPLLLPGFSLTLYLSLPLPFREACRLTARDGRLGREPS